MNYCWKKSPGIYKNHVNNGIFSTSTGEFTGFLNHGTGKSCPKTILYNSTFFKAPKTCVRAQQIQGIMICICVSILNKGGHLLRPKPPTHFLFTHPQQMTNHKTFPTKKTPQLKGLPPSVHPSDGADHHTTTGTSWETHFTKARRQGTIPTLLT